MQIKLKSTSWAVALCAATIAFASNTQAAPFSNFRVIDAATRVSPGKGGGNIQPIEKPGPAPATAQPQRHGADDPVGHDAGDDRGRHRGRGR